ncbi:MAG: hypothetical protein IKX78_03765 [Clostridia bacterium]|nr:hypothetical protein [Clostridia bacterium]
MNRIKTGLTVLMLVSLFLICALSAYAAISTATDVIWNVTETQAKAHTEGVAEEGANFFVFTWIRSTSTDMFRSKTEYSNGSSTVIAETDYVTVTYPSDIPLVTYGASCGYLPN